jgi:hypothetical protein
VEAEAEAEVEEEVEEEEEEGEDEGTPRPQISTVQPFHESENLCHRLND